ncbi:MAG TPA: DNA recombination protein RmuC [Vicinamibacterales bacterium]|nr:DNA recombination protein RmuC [Vicinamibacterales bacterium]
MITPLLVLGTLCAAAAAWALVAERRAASLAAELAAERRGSAEKLALVEQTRASLSETFAALSSDALRKNNQSFLELAGSSFEPVKSSLDKLGTHLRETEREHSALKGQLRSVSETQELLRQQTQALVNALKSPNQRGRWGEIQLRNIVERAGMAQFCGDFSEKNFIEDETGRRSIPDMTVRLPNGSCIVIDSKVPIDAYLNAVDTDGARRDALMKDHARQVREHIKGLSTKTYWAKFTPTPELVVMFVPGEPLFSAALQYDPALFDYAADQRVIPASPLTLLALLRTVASAWQQQRMAQSAEEVRALGTELYERLSVMAENIQSVGMNLKQAGAAYDRFVGSLESRVLVTARKFRELGVSAAKEIPDLDPVQIEVREPRAPELRAPVQESLIEEVSS